MKNSALRSRMVGSCAVLCATCAGSANGAEKASRSIEQLAGAIRERAHEVVAGASSFPTEMLQTLREASPTGAISWHLQSLAVLAVCVLIGWLAARKTDAWGRQHFVYLFNPTPVNRTEKVAYLLMRFAAQTVHILVFALVAALVSLAVGFGGSVGRYTALAGIGAFAGVWLVKVLFQNLLAPDAPSHRMLSIDDEAANGLSRGVVLAAAISIAALSVCLWMDALGLNPDAHLLALLGASLLGAVTLSVVAARHREAIGGMLLGAGPQALHGKGLRLFARVWHVFAILYFLGAWAVSGVRLLLGLPSAVGLVAGPLGVLFVAIGAYGLCLVVIDQFAERRRKSEGEGEDDGSAGDMAPADERSEPDVVISDGELAPKPTRTLKDLAEHGAALLVWAAALWAVLALWGVDVKSTDSFVVRVLDVAIVVFIAYLGFAAIKIAIDRRIESEGGFATAEPGDEGGAAGNTSRLATLLPIFRNFLLITVAVIAAMMVLSRMGVDIAPLFAGAGVIGLAIGFGAQTLVRDIFSGAFFLVDDAFRLGEYINVGGTKGTVEKISIRSMQLRHHLGALHTIPFGEIKQLTNHSRDWAMMKLTLRVTYDTDVDRVRKLIKNLGQELLEHPEVGEKFLQPLKSQGVFSMEDSAMILRVKFMTRPGDQFVVRKLVYQRIRELFAQHGISFAHREVTVRVAGDEDADPAHVAAAAGSAAAALDDPNRAARAAAPDR